MKRGFFVRRLRGFSRICFGQIHLRESAKSADAFRVQPAVLAPVAAGPWLKNFS
jgi:hypothetical protein